MLLMRALLNAVHYEKQADAVAVLSQLLRSVLTECDIGFDLLALLLGDSNAPALSKAAIGPTFDVALFTPLFGRLRVMDLILNHSNAGDLLNLIEESKLRRGAIASSLSTATGRVHPLILKYMH